MSATARRGTGSFGARSAPLRRIGAAALAAIAAGLILVTLESPDLRAIAGGPAAAVQGIKPDLPKLPPLPAAAPTLKVLNAGPIYGYSKMALDLRIDHYPFQDIDLNKLHQLGAFFLMPANTYAPPNPTRQADGSIRFSVVGYFQPDGGRATVQVRSANPSTRPDGSYLNVSTTVDLSPLTRYEVTNTWSLRDRLRARLVGSSPGSFCNGKPPVGTSLGIVEQNGKLTFLGRSGPLGTGCAFEVQELLVANGFVGATWRVERSGPGQQCNADLGLGIANFAFHAAVVGLDGSVQNSVFFSAEPQVIDGGLVYATGNADPVSVLRPTLVQYTCPVTLGDDVRTIRFILDSVGMRARPGRIFP
jgi:hypothetical protein